MSPEVTRLLASLAMVERLGPAAVLVRHAERGPIHDPTLGHDVPLTDRGREDARALGGEFGARAPLVIARHSPVPRCEETARLVVEGASVLGAAATLAGPVEALGGVYMIRAREALEVARDHGHVFPRLWFDGSLPSGLVVPRARGATLVVASALVHLSTEPAALAVSVTHDWNLMLVREEFFNIRHENVGWPGFLDGIAVARDGADVVLAYGNLVRRLTRAELAERPS
jgi:hypothetical protein